MHIWLYHPLAYKNIFTVSSLVFLQGHLPTVIRIKHMLLIKTTSLACVPSYLSSSVSVAHSAPATMTYLLVFSSGQLLCCLLPQNLCVSVASAVNALTPALHPVMFSSFLRSYLSCTSSGIPFPQPHRTSQTRSGPSLTYSKHYQLQESNCLLEYQLSSFLVRQNFVRTKTTIALFTTAFPAPGPVCSKE